LAQILQDSKAVPDDLYLSVLLYSNLLNKSIISKIPAMAITRTIIHPTMLLILLLTNLPIIFLLLAINITSAINGGAAKPFNAAA